MQIRTKSLSYILLSAASVTLLSIGCVILYTGSGENRQCELSAQHCKIDTALGPVSVSLESPAKPEQQISFVLSTPASATVTDITLKGENMYMGKVPVFVKKNQNNKLEGWFMLGSCSQPTMRWRMQITVKGLNDPLNIYFDAIAE